MRVNRSSFCLAIPKEASPFWGSLLGGRLGMEVEWSPQFLPGASILPIHGN